MKAFIDFLSDSTRSVGFHPSKNPDLTPKKVMTVLLNQCPPLSMPFSAAIRGDDLSVYMGMLIFMMFFMEAARIDSEVKKEFDRAIVAFNDVAWCKAQRECIIKTGNIYHQKAESVFAVCARDASYSIDLAKQQIICIAGKEAGEKAMRGFYISAELFRSALA